MHKVVITCWRSNKSLPRLSNRNLGQAGYLGPKVDQVDKVADEVRGKNEVELTRNRSNADGNRDEGAAVKNFVSEFLLELTTEYSDYTEKKRKDLGI
jgi:hypothetical protein